VGTPQQGWRHCWSSFGQFFPKNNQLKIGQKATADSPAAAQKNVLLCQCHQKKVIRVQVPDTGLMNYFSGLQSELLGIRDLNQQFQGRVIIYRLPDTDKKPEKAAMK